VFASHSYTLTLRDFREHKCVQVYTSSSFILSVRVLERVSESLEQGRKEETDGVFDFLYEREQGGAEVYRGRGNKVIG